MGSGLAGEPAPRNDPIRPAGVHSGWLFLQPIYSEEYFFCSSRMSMEASAIVPKTFCELR